MCEASWHSQTKEQLLVITLIYPSYGGPDILGFNICIPTNPRHNTQCNNSPGRLYLVSKTHKTIGDLGAGLGGLGQAELTFNEACHSKEKD